MYVGNSPSLMERAALGFTDGLPNVMLIPDISNGLWRPCWQIEDLQNQTGKSHVFAEQTFPRPNFQGTFRDLGGWTPTETCYLNIGTLYQHQGVSMLTQFTRDDTTYLKSIRLRSFITLDTTDTLNQHVNFADHTLCAHIPDPSLSGNSAPSSILHLAADQACNAAFGRLLRKMSMDVGAGALRDKTSSHGSHGSHGIMVGSNNDSKTSWCVALLWMCVGQMSLKSIVNDYIQTSRSLREYGGNDKGRKASDLKRALEYVLREWKSFDNYLLVALQVDRAVCSEFQKAMLLPMREYRKRARTTLH